MTERSYYWDGLVTGDATLAPYTAGRYTSNWKNMFTRVDDEGVISDYQNELEVTGISGAVIVDTGAALVDGYFYTNTAQENVSISTPASNPRIDRIVLRKDSVAQTVRITLLDGTEAASPTAPSLTQTHGGQFEIPLAQVLITTAGVITVTDERDYCWTPLIPAGIGLVEIESLESDGSIDTLDWDDIPQIYKHLLVIAEAKSSVGSTGSFILNGDTVAANYYSQSLYNVSTPALVSIAGNSNAGYFPSEPTSFITRYPFYTGAFYKNVMIMSTVGNEASPIAMTTAAGLLWLNTDPIDRITWVADAGVLLEGSVATLYGEA